MIRGKSPLRISLAGGGTDLNYIFEQYGGAVVNCTIDKFCHMSIEKREDGNFFINGDSYILYKHLLATKVIDYYCPKFGFNLTYYNDVPPGSGLGSSSSFIVLLLTLLYQLDGIVKSDEEIVKEAYEIDNQVKEGGWQDQYATSIGGFNFMEFNEKTLVYPLRLRYRFLQELQEHLLLVSIGGVKKIDIHRLQREHEQSNISELEKTAKIKELAFRMRDCLLNQKLNDIPNILNENWELKKNKFNTNERINQIYKLALENGALGGKLCGSGLAGHFLFFVKPEDRIKLIEALKDYKIVTFNLIDNGCETW